MVKTFSQMILGNGSGFKRIGVILLLGGSYRQLGKGGAIRIVRQAAVAGFSGFF